MSVKRIRLCIKAKGKIHDNLGHKEHSTPLFIPTVYPINPPQILTPPHPAAPPLYRVTRPLTRANKQEHKLYWK